MTQKAYQIFDHSFNIAPNFVVVGLEIIGKRDNNNKLKLFLILKFKFIYQNKVAHLVGISIGGSGVHVAEHGVLVADAQDPLTDQQGLKIK